MSAKQISYLPRWKCEHLILDLVSSIARHKAMGICAGRVRAELALIVLQLKRAC